MLSQKMMGLLALGILWINTLLIAAAAAKQAAGVLRFLRALKPLGPGQSGVGLLRGQVVHGNGVDGAIAHYSVVQVGRAATGRGAARAIHFADRTFAGTLQGGVLAVDGVRVRVPQGEGEVWPDPAQVTAAAACAEPARFATVYEEARKARGHGRTVDVVLRAGQTVWAAGQVRRDKAGLELTGDPGPGGRILISAIDPRAWIYRRAALALVFLVAEVLLAAAITAVALYPPLFGRVSTLGGLLGLGFFLAVQPVGTAVRDALLPPSRAGVRGSWVEPLTDERATSPLATPLFQNRSD